MTQKNEKAIQKLQADYANARQYAQNNIQALLADAKKRTAEKKYLVGASLFGMFCPDYLEFKISDSKQGKLVAEFPGKHCQEVWLDKNGKLVYMKTRCADSSFDHESYLPVDFNGYTYYLYASQEKFETFMNSFRAKYENGLLTEWTEGDMWMSKYTHHKNGQIECTREYFYPEAKNKWLFQFRLNSKGKVEDLVELY